MNSHLKRELTRLVWGGGEEWVSQCKDPEGRRCLQVGKPAGRPVCVCVGVCVCVLKGEGAGFREYDITEERRWKPSGEDF